MFPLDIFPERSLAGSVITTVWVGVAVVAFFNLRLGWPFSGVVVPGYLVPILIAKPLAGVVICLEGFVTYAIVRRISDSGLRSPKESWSSFFGRDRFFALILTSLLVRLVLDGWVLPIVGEAINRWFSIEFDYRNNLCSFGLIIVALLANQFWKTGFTRGLVPFTVTVGVTYFIVRQILMVYTNFNIGNLEYMYENISSSLVASPKAYVILVTTAFLASRMNLIYGWDFNGILIPSLLALQWYQPEKIATSFAEALVILIAAILLLRTRWFRDQTIEGARKLLLFFNISFLYKFVLAHGFSVVGSEVSPSELYGFGYLLPTLIAIKMHDKRSVMRFFRATFQMSLMGAIAASLVGFVLTYVPEFSSWEVPDAEAEVVTRSSRSDGGLVERLRDDKLRTYERRVSGSYANPLPQEVDIFVRGVRLVRRYVETRDSSVLRFAQRTLGRIGYQVALVDGKFLFLSETGGARGWGTYVFRLDATSGLLVEVPDPFGEWAVLESGAYLFEEFGAATLAISGSSRRESEDRSSDVLSHPRTIFQSFHRIMARRGVLQVRGYSDKSLARLYRVEGVRLKDSTEDVSSGLWVDSSFPEGVDYARLESILGTYIVRWGATPFTNVQRDETTGGFAELVLSRRERKKLLALAVVGERVRSDVDSQMSSGATFEEWMRGRRDTIAQRDSEQYVKPAEEELLFLDLEVVDPLLTLLRESSEREVTGDDLIETVRLLDASARSVGYRVLLRPGAREGTRFIVLTEDSRIGAQRHWGFFAFRVGPASPFSIQVPRPILEQRTFEYGLQLFSFLNARALLIAGSHPWANSDGSADVVLQRNRSNLFNCVHQSITRKSGLDPLMTVQVRAFGPRALLRGVTTDVMIGFGSGVSKRGRLSVLGGEILEALEQRQMSVELIRGAPHSSGYEAYGSSQSRYLWYAPNKEFCVLWLSPHVRSAVSQQDGESTEAAQFRKVGVRTREVDFSRYAESFQDAVIGSRVPEEAVEKAVGFLETRNILALEELVDHCGVDRVLRIVDRSTGYSLLVIEPRGEEAAVAVKLGGHGDVRWLQAKPWQVDSKIVDRFLRSRSTFLLIGGK